MKTIRGFMASKIRRMEVQHAVALVTEGAAHPDLGEFQGRLDTDAVEFYARGIRFCNTQVVDFTDILRVERSPADDGGRWVDVVVRDGEVARLSCTADGGAIIHATLRWIGHTQLGRCIAD